MAKWRRGRSGGLGADALAWIQYNKELKAMADAGGQRAAYRCQVVGEQLVTVFAPQPQAECATVNDAVARLERGEAVVVASVDMGQLRSRLASFGVG